MGLKNQFFQESKSCCSEYKAVRENENRIRHKAFIESLWEQYKEYADNHFLTDACRHFHERFWEMYLGVSFLDQGYLINAGSSKGPEFYFSLKDSQSKLWVEATAPGLGTGHDAVPELIPDGNMRPFPENEILLRIRNAMQCNAMQCNAMQCNAMQCNKV